MQLSTAKAVLNYFVRFDEGGVGGLNLSAIATRQPHQRNRDALGRRRLFFTRVFFFRGLAHFFLGGRGFRLYFWGRVLVTIGAHWRGTHFFRFG